jgi:hypothetical protein
MLVNIFYDPKSKKCLTLEGSNDSRIENNEIIFLGSETRENAELFIEGFEKAQEITRPA